MSLQFFPNQARIKNLLIFYCFWAHASHLMVAYILIWGFVMAISLPPEVKIANDMIHAVENMPRDLQYTGNATFGRVG